MTWCHATHAELVCCVYQIQMPSISTLSVPETACPSKQISVETDYLQIWKCSRTCNYSRHNDFQKPIRPKLIIYKQCSLTHNIHFDDIKYDTGNNSAKSPSNFPKKTLAPLHSTWWLQQISHNLTKTYYIQWIAAYDQHHVIYQQCRTRWRQPT